MRKFGIGTVLALAGFVALAAGAFALALRDDGNAAVTQVAGDGDAEARFEGPPPGAFGAGPMGPPGGFRGGMHFRRPSAEDILERREEFAKELAAELDKSTEEVQDALRAVFKKHLDQAVEDENLTQKQADRILKCYDTAKCRPPGHAPFGR
jgi:hypothetical protein